MKTPPARPAVKRQATRGRSDAHSLKPLAGSFVAGSGLLALAYATTLVLTAKPIGYSRDESFYFDAARRYAGWFNMLLEHGSLALKQGMVDAHFGANHEHPPLMKLLFGLSNHYLYDEWHWVNAPGLSYRLPAIAVAAVSIWVVMLWGARSISRTAGLVAGLCLAFMPRYFHHAHLACFDVPVASMCLVTAYVWSRALQSRGWGWSALLALTYGMTLATKHNAWFLPLALLLHGLLAEGRRFIHSPWRARLQLARPLLALGVGAPLVFFALWPWMWFDTMERLTAWFAFHLRHDYYNMEFLGFTYWKPPMPLAYAWVMTLATVPLTTLVLSLLGVVSAAQTLKMLLMRHSPAQDRANASPLHSDYVLWGLCVLVSYAPWWSSETPIFGGTKHWMTAYPCLALLAGLGFDRSAKQLVKWWPRAGKRRFNPVTGARVALATLVVLPGCAMVADMGPYGLSTYTPLVGEAAGAATLGLNRTFWGYTTVTLARELTSRSPGRLFLHDMTGGALDMHQRDGDLPRGLTGTLSIPNSELALYHYEPHMGRVEYQIWSAYNNCTPVNVGTYQGVPVIWLYDRRRK